MTFLRTLGITHLLLSVAVFALHGCGTEGGNPHRKSVEGDPLKDPPSTQTGKTEQNNPGPFEEVPGSESGGEDKADDFVELPADLATGGGVVSAPNQSPLPACQILISNEGLDPDGLGGFLTELDSSDPSSFSGIVPNIEWPTTVQLTWSDNPALSASVATPQAGEWTVQVSATDPSDETRKFQCEESFELDETVIGESRIVITIFGSVDAQSLEARFKNGN